jgi:hypothetical protein
MSEQQKKIYVGNGKIVRRKNDGAIMFRKVGLNLSRIAEADVEAFIKTLQSGKQILNIVINDLQEPDQYGNDVSITVDTWKPTGEGQPQQQGYQRRGSLNAKPDGRIQEQVGAPQDDDLPF